MIARLRRTAARAASHRLFRRPVLLPEGFEPSVSFTFDDFPQSAVDLGEPILRAAGMKATWYAAAGMLGQDSPGGPIAGPATVAALHAAGHEIGDHTRLHLKAEAVAPDRYGRDMAANQAELARLAPGLAVRSFSYPFGSFTPLAKRAAMARAASGRTTERGVARGLIDLGLLPANRLFSSEPWSEVTDVIADVRRGGGWAIFYTHDIAARPSAYGCTPDAFARAVELVAAAGIAVRSVGEVVASLAGSA